LQVLQVLRKVRVIWGGLLTVIVEMQDQALADVAAESDCERTLDWQVG